MVCCETLVTQATVKWRINRLTIVRHFDKIWLSLMYRMKAEINDGLFSGCLNRCSGSGWSQYSSSQSTGRSTSKLEWKEDIEILVRCWRVAGIHPTIVLFVMNSTRSTQGSANQFVHTYKYPMNLVSESERNRIEGEIPEGPIPLLILCCQSLSLPLMCPYILSQT